MSNPNSSAPTDPARVAITRAFVGVCHMQVCVASDATDEEILTLCNTANPAGTSNGWTTVIRSTEANPFWGDVAPVPCGDDPTRLHLLVSC